MRILILTPIEIEYQAVRKHLPASNPQMIDGRNYLHSHFSGKFHQYEIILTQTGIQNNNFALATEKAIQIWKPEIACLIGIAGGVKDVSIGDVLFVSKVYGYDGGKETQDGYVARPEVFNHSPDLIQIAQKTSTADTWKNRSLTAKNAKIFCGPIASGDKLIANKESIVYQRIQQHFNDTLAVDMESLGFASALQTHPGIKFMSIRGISDLLSDKTKTDALGSQQIAIDNATAFAFEVFYQLNYSSLNLPNEIMELKKFVKQVHQKILPLIKNEAGLKAAIPQSEHLPLILEKIKLLAPEEYAELLIDPKEEDAHAMLRNRIKKHLHQDQNLLAEIKELIQQHQIETTANNTNIKIKKNVIEGSTIKVKGDFRLGDGH